MQMWGAAATTRTKIKTRGERPVFNRGVNPVLTGCPRGCLTVQKSSLINMQLRTTHESLIVFLKKKYLVYMVYFSSLVQS